MSPELSRWRASYCLQAQVHGSLWLRYFSQSRALVHYRNQIRLQMASHPSEEAPWPRDFRLAPPTTARAKFWSHELYRGPHNQPVRILYSRTKMQSEEIAQEFLGERVLGFDMEWPWQNPEQREIPLQQRIGLIQIASEDKIGLFHIGLHTGQTAKDVLAPTLRQIIESDNVSKTGVAILNADFARLRRWFGLKPRGALELSHFHNLVTYGKVQPTRVTTKMKALRKLVEEHLGLPLYKGKVRTSNWSRPLNQAQILYAAADAYAGVMLYHCMNAKRLAIDPPPPLPLHAELYLPMRPGMGSIMPVRLGPSSKSASGISAAEFFEQSIGGLDQPHDEASTTNVEDGNHGDQGGEDHEESEEEALDGSASTQPDDQLHAQENVGLVMVGRRGRQILLGQKEPGTISKFPVPNPSVQPTQRQSRKTAREPREDLKPGQDSKQAPCDPAISKAIFERLRAHRKDVAQERQCAPFVVAHNTLLTAISENCPRNEHELRQIKGIGKVKAEMYGTAWLAIVHDCIEERGIVAGHEEKSMATPVTSPKTPTRSRRETATVADEVIIGHQRSPPVLHTGLSFKMENATLGMEFDQGIDEMGDDSSAFGSPLRSPSPSTLKRKRGLLDSAAENQSRQHLALPKTLLQSRHTLAKTTPGPDVPTTDSMTHSATNAMRENSPQIGVVPTTLPHPHQKAPMQIFSPYGAPNGADSVPKRQVSVEAQIFRNKLLAFNRRVTSTFTLSEATIEHIVQTPPKTAQELLKIPNILPFANACARQNQCLLTFILKSTMGPRRRRSFLSSDRPGDLCKSSE